VTGTVTVTGAPAGFVPGLIGAGACPSSGPPGQACTNPTYALANGNTYSLSLSAGSWRISGFYELSGFGGAFLGAPQIVTVPANGTVTENLTVAYQRPATLKGEIHVTDVPAGVQIQEFTVLLCPSFAPYTGAFPSIACVNGYNQSTSSPDSGSYEITGLPPGIWTAYPGYCTQFGCETNAKAGKSVALFGGRTSTANVTTPYILPGDGLLNATVTVTGAPSGFSASTSLTACQVGAAGNCQTYYGYGGNGYGYGGNSYQLLLADGKWTVTGSYLASPFDNTVNGPTQTVDVVGGVETTVNVSVPYQVPGTAFGKIRVVGAHPHAPITTYTMIACPASSPMTGGFPSSACVNEYSGSGGFGFGVAISSVSNPVATSERPPAEHTMSARAPYNEYLLSGLTPGSWILCPGYETNYGSYVDPLGTTVSIVAGLVTTKNLTVPYQTPTNGLVRGKVNVIGAPANGASESGVQACSQLPTATTCQDEQVAYNQSSNTYQLALAPGTWWVSGFVDIFDGLALTPSQSLSPPVEITVTAGTQIKQNFTVTVGAP
jgi:hypothetical protein